MKLKKITSIVLLISLLFSATPAVSSENDFVCMDKNVAGKVLIDLTICKQNTDLLNQAVTLYETKINGLEKDKEILKNESSQYKNLYIKESLLRQEAEKEKPSKAVWFGIGAVSTAIAGLLGLFLAR